MPIYKDPLQLPKRTTASTRIRDLYATETGGIAKIQFNTASGTVGQVATATTTGSADKDVMRFKTSTGNFETVAANVIGAVITRVASGTTDTLVAADVGKEVRLTNAATKVVTVPVTATLGVDFICAIYNYGAGAATITPASGVTLRNLSGTLAQYKTLTIRAVGTDEYQIEGA